jgi:hypothetical protein
MRACSLPRHQLDRGFCNIARLGAMTARWEGRPPAPPVGASARASSPHYRRAHLSQLPKLSAHNGLTTALRSLSLSKTIGHYRRRMFGSSHHHCQRAALHAIFAASVLTRGSSAIEACGVHERRRKSALHRYDATARRNTRAALGLARTPNRMAVDVLRLSRLVHKPSDTTRVCTPGTASRDENCQQASAKPPGCWPHLRVEEAR